MSPNGAQDENGVHGTLTEDQVDIIGEVSNISMGSAATALSNIIGNKVTITSPQVKMGSRSTVEEIQSVPSIGVIISYTEGIVGSDVLVIKKADATEIVNILMGGELPEDEEFGELHISAIAEVMNQMMGSSATALSGFIGRSVYISPPDAFILTEENKTEKLGMVFDNIEDIVLIKFLFSVENMFESDIYMMMTHEFMGELVQVMLDKMGITDTDQVKVENTVPPEPPRMQPPAQQTREPVQNSNKPGPRQPEVHEDIQVQAAAVAAPVTQTAIHRAVFQDFEPQSTQPSEGLSNFELIQEMPLELSVEVGRAQKLIKDVMDFSVGTIIELDKQAGDPVDIIVNGQLIAYGEVVVIDESFGVRVTEIINKKTRRR